MGLAELGARLGVVRVRHGGLATDVLDPLALIERVGVVFDDLEIFGALPLLDAENGHYVVSLDEIAEVLLRPLEVSLRFHLLLVVFARLRSLDDG